MNYDYNDDLMSQMSAILSSDQRFGPSTRHEIEPPNSTWEVSDTNLTLFYEPTGDLANIELFIGYSAPLLTLATASCLLFMLVGIPGNLITIIALFRCKKVRNATAVFIINLSVSDLMSCCFNLPLAASTFWQRAWRHGILLCRLFPLLRYGLLAVSLFTVLAITINRYVMIGHPTLYPKLYKKQYLGLMVAATWLCGFGALVATWLGKWGRFGLDPRVGSCSILPDQSGRSPKEFLFLVAFVIPCLSIVVCYARIFYIVRKTAVKSRASNNARGAAPRTYPRRVGRWEADSAVGSSTGPSYSTDKSSSVTEVTDSTSRSFHVTLAPPRVIPDPSSSSGVEEYSPPGSPKPRTGLAAVLRPRLSRLSPRRHSVPPQPGKMTAKDKKLLKMILVIFASFVTCYLPITISKTFRDRPELKALNIAGYILIYLTTCINPIIYVVMSSEYRQAYKNLLMCRSPDSQLNTASKP